MEAGPVVTLPNGKIQGVSAVTLRHKISFNAYMGIPFAAAPVGKLRFQVRISFEPVTLSRSQKIWFAFSFDKYLNIWIHYLLISVIKELFGFQYLKHYNVLTSAPFVVILPIYKKIISFQGWFFSGGFRLHEVRC